MEARFSPAELKEIGKEFEEKEPQEVLSWALDNFHPDIALACSFGAEDMVLLDMIVKIRKDARVFYLDTGLLFPEAYQLRDLAIAHYHVSLERYASDISLEEQDKRYGPELWSREPDMCCKLRKVEPLRQAFQGLAAWITGIRREQAPARANAGVVEFDQKFGLVKVNPLVRWSFEQVWEYILKNNVPYNPLHDQGYPSIGCQPCTRPVKPGEDPRAGRWAGRDKTECGLHR